MEDIRISIRLTQEKHRELKIISAKTGVSIQDMMSKVIDQIIKDSKNEKKN